ncbi:MAG: DUF6489 family protein [Alphaproteobacteria bacterium]|nr:DUF6489 family protein [Alphaproteobacteria bacterium]OIN85525.1 MAG: hypothetical protein AUJ12_09080 [Alphaproteobacteria bacterium CG1_02_46_17]
MRFEVNIDCTPEEARQFFGLPDLLPMQQDLMEMVSRRLSENIQTMEADKLIQTWLPAMFQGWSDMQSHFWNQMTQMGGKMSSPMGMGGVNFNMNPSPKSKPDKDKK